MGGVGGDTAGSVHRMHLHLARVSSRRTVDGRAGPRRSGLPVQLWTRAASGCSRAAGVLACLVKGADASQAWDDAVMAHATPAGLGSRSIDSPRFTPAVLAGRPGSCNSRAPPLSWRTHADRPDLQSRTPATSGEGCAARCVTTSHAMRETPQVHSTSVHTTIQVLSWVARAWS